MKALIQGLNEWVDHRTGHRALVHDALYENIPGGSRWIYVTGSMLVMAFVTQVFTGIFLWMYYSAGSQNAWESVYWIQNEIQYGWFLRGVHHYMSQAMIVLLPVHLLQVVLCKAYIKPREMNYWMGLVLMLIVMALGLTGYLLPWDQKGYWATKVATELMSLPPGGGWIQKLVIGGSEYGHYTLTRFFALHAGVLPGILVIVLILHVALFRKHGIKACCESAGQDEFFWPQQMMKDAVACLLMLLAVTIIVICRGAELGPPAEPTESYGAARPEWFYLFLFQLLKYFHFSEFIGAIVVPGLVMLFLFLMPLTGRVRFGHIVNVVLLLIVFVTAGYLTYEAISHDQYARHSRPEPKQTNRKQLHFERVEASEKFLAAKAQSEREYERVTELIEMHGIPREGTAVGLIRNDPMIQGPRLFARYCASCHSFTDEHGEGILGPFEPRDKQGDLLKDPDPYGAPNLYGFGSRQWLEKLLNPDAIISNDVFGATAHREGDMVTFVQDELVELDDQQKQTLKTIIAAVSAEANLPVQQEQDNQARQDGTIEQGIAALSEPINYQTCLDCHDYHGDGGGSAPDLTGYASDQWLKEFISDPEHERFYGASETNDRMPKFAKFSEDPSKNLLTEREIDLLVRWLRSDP